MFGATRDGEDGMVDGMDMCVVVCMVRVLRGVSAKPAVLWYAELSYNTAVAGAVQSFKENSIIVEQKGLKVTNSLSLLRVLVLLLPINSHSIL